MNKKSLISVTTLQTFLNKITEIFAKKSDVDNALSGKADVSHGTHVDYATTAGKAPGTAAVGTSSKVAREDHVHPLQTTINGYTIQTLTQAEYDALSTVDPNTIYIIK